MKTPTRPEDLLDFPCHYQFKAIGLAGDEFFSAVVQAVEKYVPVSRDAAKSKSSGKGNYQSVSILVTLHSYDQLTRIYAEIRRIPHLKMLL